MRTECKESKEKKTKTQPPSILHKRNLKKCARLKSFVLPTAKVFCYVVLELNNLATANCASKAIGGSSEGPYPLPLAPNMPCTKQSLISN